VSGNGTAAAPRPQERSAAYKWIALSNTTLGVLLVAINESILIIALPAIFRGIKLNPLVPSNSFYLLWILLGFMLVTAVLVVTLGRIGDIYGRVRMYNLGFAVFTLFSILLSVNWLHGPAAGAFIVGMRIGQGVGGSFLFANSAAILTDAFPENERGLALGINNIAGIAGAFIGLVVGGVLAPVDWRLVFIVSAPVGLFGTVWAYLKLEDNGVRTPAKIDWWGNALFAVGLTLVLIGITYGIEPSGHSAMGWTSPKVLAELSAGAALLVVFAVVESKVAQPMFRLSLFRIRAFLFGNVASLLAAIGRGGLMFLFVMWLQGIWLPLHGYSFSQTPLWAGIYMLPMTFGFLVAGPVSGILSDRYGARPFATAGMAAAALTFVGFVFLPINFSYPVFAVLMLANGLAMGLFASPNRAAVMNSLPPDQRGAGAGMSGVFQNAAMVLSMGIFFTLMISGIASALPGSLEHGLVAQHVPAQVAAGVSHLPPITSLFASLLGYNPMQKLLGSSVLAHLPAHSAAVVTGRAFFPTLLAKPFGDGLTIAFTFGAIACALAALSSLLRGGKYVYGQDASGGQGQAGTAEPQPAAALAGAASGAGSELGGGSLQAAEVRLADPEAGSTAGHQSRAWMPSTGLPSSEVRFERQPRNQGFDGTSGPLSG
jgi:MFS family permease